jgi:hypothetical protein
MRLKAMHTWPGLRRISAVLGPYWVMVFIGLLGRAGVGSPSISQFSIRFDEDLSPRQVGYTEGVLKILQGFVLLYVAVLLGIITMYAPLIILVGVIVAMLILGAIATRTVYELTVIQDDDGTARRETPSQEVVA